MARLGTDAIDAGSYEGQLAGQVLCTVASTQLMCGVASALDQLVSGGRRWRRRSGLESPQNGPSHPKTKPAENL